jgi:hypothetical protein
MAASNNNFDLFVDPILLNLIDPTHYAPVWR